MKNKKHLSFEEAEKVFCKRYSKELKAGIKQHEIFIKYFKSELVRINKCRECAKK